MGAREKLPESTGGQESAVLSLQEALDAVALQQDIVRKRTQRFIDPARLSALLEEGWSITPGSSSTTMRLVPPQSTGEVVGFPKAELLIDKARREANLGIGSI